jgi:monoamine oxidase
MASNISRRAFVARAATVAGALALPTLASTAPASGRHPASNDSDKEVLDLAIVGAGISGIYCAWRLVTVDPASLRILGKPVSTGRRLRVTVFEGSRRVGGRLLSARAPDLSAICDLGGMRFASSHKRVVSLVNEFKLPNHGFYTSHPRNHVLLRGKHLRVSDLNNPALLPYRLTPAEQECVSKNGPDVLIQCALIKLLPGLAELHGDDLFTYLQAAEIDGTPLYQHGLWNLLARTMSSEARSLAQATIGFEELGSNFNAVDLLMQYLLHTPDVTFHALDGGYDALPWMLQGKFEDAGGEVVHGAWLEGLSPLTLADGSVGVELHFAGECPAVKARAIILAMPRRPLEVLLPRFAGLAPRSSAAFSRLLGSVTPDPGVKCFIRYPTAWWRATGVCRGHSLTDLPIRQCFYWTESQQQQCGTERGEALIMIYSTATSAAFWGGFGPNNAQTELSTADACRVRSNTQDDNARLRENWGAYRAPAELVVEMHRQILALHGVQSAPEPLEAVSVNWSDDPFGGLCHLWNPGVRSWQATHEMTQPIDDLPCYVCGEAYSTMQTWVEGALSTADLVHQRLNLPGRVV